MSHLSRQSLFGLDAQVSCEAYACDVVRGELFPSAFLLFPCWSEIIREIPLR